MRGSAAEKVLQDAVGDRTSDLRHLTTQRGPVLCATWEFPSPALLTGWNRLGVNTLINL